MTAQTTIALFVNDAAHAQAALKSLRPGQASVQWVLVACPPMLSRHIGRWVSQSGRRHWIERWSRDLLQEVEQQVRFEGAAGVERVVAQKSLVHISTQLKTRYGAVQLVDARRPHLGRTPEPLEASHQPETQVSRGWFPLFLTTGLGAIFALGD
ncbi:MAG: hypothetical protein RLZZ618_724 [Pseudomonadota bacterium]|jgi:hypothetical protein